MDTKKLRQKILDLAIHGKLVPQDPNDEPASVLLERIRAEKKQLIKEGKIKKSKKTTTSDKSPYQNDVPFEIPVSWEWTTVNDISKSILYGVSESAKSDGTYKLLRITDIQDNYVNWDTVPFTDFNKEKALEYLLQEGDILFARTGATVGKSYLVNGINCNSIYASYLIKLQTFSFIRPQYVKLFFESGFYWNQITIKSVGVGQPNVNGTTLGQLSIPIPPLYEQKRIVEEVEKWFTMIGTIEANKTDLQTAIKQAKAKILDLAIHGKLVPQNPNDEPAIEILKRINPDFTPCDNSHYPIILPSLWTWATIEQIATSNIGLTYKPTDICSNGIPVLRSNNIQNRKLDLTDLVRVDSIIQEKQILRNGDLLICARNGSRNLVGKCTIVNDLTETTSFGAFMTKVKSPYNRWIDIVLNTDYFDHYLDDSNSTAINQITQKMLLAFAIPFPPIEEQNRIMTKTEELFTWLDSITNNLKA